MKPLDLAVKLWQRAPQSWRARLAASSIFGPLVRSAANKAGPANLNAFDLAEPLRGMRMLLDWQTQKAYVFGTYEPEVAAAIQNSLSPGALAIDVGAHIGYHTLLMARLVGPGGRVFAFEPWPQNFELLRRNLELNGMANVTAVNKAVMVRSAEVKMASGADAVYSATSAVRDDGGIEASSISLDEFAASLSPGQRVALVKIDTEGTETDVLRGMTGLLRSHRPDVIVELHGYSQQGGNHSALVALTVAGYQVRFLEHPGAQAHVLARPGGNH